MTLDELLGKVMPRPCACCAHVGDAEIAADRRLVMQGLQAAYDMGRDDTIDKIRRGANLRSQPKHQRKGFA